MEQLNAFVGHSFTEEDADIVRVFLKFFDTVKKIEIGFDWEHAEEAKSKTLREKVLQLIEGKNLFIGICTNKEAAIHPSKLKKSAFNNSLKAVSGEFEAKTSDWIIQEIGLAIGRKMELILLVENGVRQPGGLQGNLEYITFERNSPEKSFEKILEMIQSLLAKTGSVIKEEKEVLVVPREEQDEEIEDNEDWKYPKPDWNRLNYEIGLMHMMALDDNEGAERIKAAYLKTEEGGLLENKVSWDAFYEHRLIFWGKGGSLETLKKLSKDNPTNSKVHSFLGMGYREYDDFDQASKSFKLAADVADSVSQKIKSLAECIDSLDKAGKQDEARKIALEMKKLMSEDEDSKTQVLKALRAFSENNNDADSFLGLTEQYLSLCPDDIGARFDLAYKYSKNSLDELSLMHYLKIPTLERKSATWNNLGVQFDHFKLVKKSVEAYRRAEKMGETLAMNNLAQKLINAGFITEAEEICTKAIGIDDYHKNIGHSISRIKNLPEEEAKKEAETIEKAKPISEFYKYYGYALTQDELPDYSGLIQGPDCRLNIKIEGGRFLAEGSYEQTANALGLGNALAGFALAQPKPTKYLLRYEGAIEGRTVSGSYTKKAEGESPKTEGFLGAVMNGTNILMVFSDDFDEILVYEKNGSRTDKIHTMKKITEGGYE
jgi:tetratricopeptide (TPR) repeat protein